MLGLRRLEEAEARDRVKERKARTRTLIQRGAILERAFPQTRDMDLERLEAYLHDLARTKNWRNETNDEEAPGDRGFFSFGHQTAKAVRWPRFSRRARLYPEAGLGVAGGFPAVQCSPEWHDREKLWNAVESAEKTKDSRLAREFVVALPVELDKDQWQILLTEYIQQQFSAEGMCADVAIHDPYPPGHNPHAHMMLTVRPLDEQGQWQYKTEKEYLCVRNGEERGFTAAEVKLAQADGWEKQYPYKVGKEQKAYMAPSVAEAQGLERASKYPKSTKFGRQNPIAERWNSESQIILWRAAWAEATNRHLERAGSDATIDHRCCPIHETLRQQKPPGHHRGWQTGGAGNTGRSICYCNLRSIAEEANVFTQAKSFGETVELL